MFKSIEQAEGEETTAGLSSKVVNAGPIFGEATCACPDVNLGGGPICIQSGLRRNSRQDGGSLGGNELGYEEGGNMVEDSDTQGLFDVARTWGQVGAGWDFVGSNGAAGGLLLIWDESGAHNRDAKIQVWEELSYMAGLYQVPSCYMRDFNEIVHVEERQCTNVLPRSAEEFRSWIQDMHLVDLPLTDCKFSWFQGRSCSHIDRALVSVEWLEEFPESRIRGRPRGLSDHCPVILEYMRQREEWRNLGEMQFTDKLKALMVSLRNWHKNKFGDMNKKITKFEEEIKKIDDLDNSPMMSFRDGLVSRIEQADAINMEALPTAEEIREAVCDCESSKAPGCDEYNMNFVKRCWGEIGHEFTAAVMGFFQTSRLPTDSNITWVALAPKFIGAKEIKDLRLISMVGCVYKVISKVLVRRMRPVIPTLVRETQNVFVRGRKIHDGALIACKMVNWPKLRKKEAAIIKLDSQNAYDRVRWSFVDIVFQKMGFGNRWRSWVMECMSTTSMSVLINGSPSKPFKMERGLRQGDPLSPFLFVLVVDVLHRLVGETIRNGRISPLLIGRDSIALSHLQFTDDTILFCPPEEELSRITSGY
ncbi:uncharacterized protein [Arachis hypogaea]|uniref:uncharacterized protein n=1 Tax=Arachis hypogaea TaxID=3818 RepID=UPI003B223250